MTANQKRIRERAITDLMNYKGFGRALCKRIVDCVLGTLNSEDVMIKDESKLPSVFDIDDNVISAMRFKRKLAESGYLEPLIKER